ncbi:MAG: hypothetical protein ABJU19_19840 [Roseobacter sp.]
MKNISGHIWHFSRLENDRQIIIELTGQPTCVAVKTGFSDE